MCEAVAPVGVAAGGEEVEGALALLGRFAVSDGLEGEGEAEGGDALAVVVGFAVPDELGHRLSVAPRLVCRRLHTSLGARAPMVPDAPRAAPFPPTVGAT
jgi:hypothetical protein